MKESDDKRYSADFLNTEQRLKEFFGVHNIDVDNESRIDSPEREYVKLRENATRAEVMAGCLLLARFTLLILYLEQFPANSSFHNLSALQMKRAWLYLGSREKFRVQF